MRFGLEDGLEHTLGGAWSGLRRHPRARSSDRSPGPAQTALPQSQVIARRRAQITLRAKCGRSESPGGDGAASVGPQKKKSATAPMRSIRSLVGKTATAANTNHAQELVDVVEQIGDHRSWSFGTQTRCEFAPMASVSVVAPFLNSNSTLLSTALIGQGRVSSFRGSPGSCGSKPNTRR